MTVPRRRRSLDGARAGAMAVGLLFSAAAMLGCASRVVPPTGPSPTVGPTAPSPTGTPPASIGASPAPGEFAWAARPEAFPGEEGASLASVAAGPAGFVALSAHALGESSQLPRLWRATDGVQWQRLNPTGLGEQGFITGVWGASDQYWLRAHFPESDDPGTLYQSSDGVTWRPSRDLSERIAISSVVQGCAGSTTGVRDECPVFLTGTEDVDGVILRSTDQGETWSESTVADATGWKGAQDAAPVEILGIVAIADGLLAFGNGLPNASDTGGFLQSRFWRSEDGGVTWARIPNAAPLGELYVRDVVASDELVVAVGEGLSGSLAAALVSADGGRTWARASTSADRAEGTLSQVLIGRAGFLGLGFANPAQVDAFPVREFAWTSVDGSDWHTIPGGALEGGIVEDAVRFRDVIAAVGRGWSTDATGTWEAPYGPAAWRLEP